MKSREEVIRLRAYLPDYLRECGISKLNRHFRCLSPNHEDRHPSMSYNPKNQTVHCFSCGFTADIFDLFAINNGLSTKTDFPKIITELKLKYLECVSCKSAPIPKNQNPTTSVCSCKSAPYISGGVSQYLESRGLKPETILFFGAKEHKSFTINDRQIGPCVTIPYGEKSSYYLVRELDKKRFIKPKDQKEPIFMEEFLLQTEKPVVIVESAICAMSVYQCGYYAVAINGTGWMHFVEYLEGLSEVPHLILCMDQDDIGRKTEASMCAKLQEIKIAFSCVSGLHGAKDPNELLCTENGEEKLIAALKAAEEQIVPVISNAMDYLKHQYLIDLYSESNSPLSTGFSSLDMELGNVKQGLYVLGGASGLGKTTFILELACSFAEQGREVLYFSYEASQKQLLEKCLSRESINSDVEFEVEDISSLRPEELLSAIKNFENTAKHLHIIDKFYDIERLADEIYRYKDQNPVVIIDYLQVIPCKGFSEKAAIDELMKRLYQLTREYDLIMFILSSLSRSSYLYPARLDSFKESGMVEYHADYCFVLQYQILSVDPIFLTDGRIAEKTKKLELERKKLNRKIELVCLKNRFGNGTFSVPLNYDVRFHHFTEATKQKTLRCI